FFQLFDDNRCHLAFAGDEAVHLSASELLEREADVALALRDVVIPRAAELYRQAKEWDHGDEEDEEEEEEEEEEESGEEDEYNGGK
ncbi:unnamed protein product, partial [Closterium sp. NIES-54]